ncbi:MAG TPA: RpiB/LacA/LacB family sugar-phosphate isomerase [Acidimicrobiales bacterium]|nr:RpiB/LacA/LacB family sugar-phosphate isomerase [Acidimicrobiales bacterium]
MRIAFGTDEDTELTRSVVARLRSAGHQVTHLAEGEAWPEVGSAVGRAVSAGEAERGIVCCYTGTGVSIAANKVPGVRAALCTDGPTAAGARRWNDANVLAFGLRLTSLEVAAEMIDTFLGTAPDDDELAAVARLEGPVVGGPGPRAPR